jgi:hypothetical protein
MDYQLVPLDEEVEFLDEKPVEQAIPDPEDEAPPNTSESAPTTAAPPPTKTEPVHEAPSAEIPEAPDIPEVTFAADKPKPLKLVPVDEEFEDYVPEPKAKPRGADSWLDPKDYALFRGAAEGFETLKGGKEFLTVLDMSLGNMSDEEKLAKILSQDPVEAPSEWERREPSVSDIGSASEAWTYALEALGSGVTSTIPGVVGGAAGAALGGAATVNPIGAAIGAYAGAAAPSMALGLSGMYNDLRANEGVRKALENGSLTVDQFQRLVLIGGALVGGLDAFPAAKFGKGLGLQAAKDAVRDTFIKAAIKGGFEEGATEGLQQITSEVTQSQGGGDTSLKQQALNVIDAALQGAIGGLVFGAAGRSPKAAEDAVADEVDDEIADNAGETEPKTDDQSERSNTVQPEGTPAATTPAAGQPTPGNVSAGTAPPPAGTDKQPLPPVDPTVPASEQPEPAGQPAPKQPGVTIVQPGRADADIAAALGGDVEDVGEFDIEEEAAAAGTPLNQQDLRDQERRIAGLFRQETERAQETAAQATKIEPAGTDIAAAMAAQAPPPQQPIVAPQIPAGVQAQAAQSPVIQNALAARDRIAAAQQETLGTGRALQPLAPEPVAAAEPTAAPEEQLQQPPPAQAAAEVQEPAAISPAPAPLEELPLAEEIEPVGDKFMGEEAERRARAKPRLVPVTEEVVDVTPEEVAAFTAKPAAGPPTQRTPGKLSLKGKAAAPTPLTPGAKGARFKKSKAEPTPAAPELIKTREQAAAGVVGQPTPSVAPAPVSEAQRAISREAHEQLQSSLVSELPEFRDTVDAVTAEHLKENPRGDRSPRQYEREEAPKIAAKVKEKLAAAAEAKAEEDVKAAEYLTTYGRKKQEKAAKKTEMAEAETGQKKERAGKKKGKSAEGLRAEGVESTERAYKRELKKPEAERDTELVAWGELREQQKKLPTKAVKERAALEEQMKFHQENRATAAEVREAAGPPLSERAQAAERAASVKIESVPMPSGEGSSDEQHAATNAFFEAFIRATKDLKLHPHHDTKHQSAAENLVIYARKVEKNLLRNQQGTGKYQGIGPTDFVSARQLYEEGAIDEMNDMVVSEQLSGTGYNEAVGKAPKQAWTESEDEGHIRSHESAAGYEPLADIEFKRRGRAQTRADTQQEREAEQKHETTGKKIDVWVKGTRPISVTADSDKASRVLRDISRWMNAEGDQKGFWSVLRNAHIRHLMKMVGDVDVHFISDADMRRLADGKANVQGLYLNYSNEARAHGFKPEVFINADIHGSGAESAHTVIHELTHAATSQALRDNVRGTRSIIETMRVALQNQLFREFGGRAAVEAELERRGIDYAFTDEAEFIAEAFSNVEFQKLLAKMTVPPSIRAEIQALGKGRTPTWWDAFTAAVSNAIGMVSGQRGQTYMEQVIALNPHIARSSTTQQFLARRETFGPTPKPLPRPTFESMFDGQMLVREAQDQFDAVKDKFDSWTGAGRRKQDIFASTGELIRRAPQWFGGPDNVFEKLAKLHLRFDQLRAKYRRHPTDDIDNEAVEKAAASLRKNKPREYLEAGRLMNDMTAAQVNGTVGLNHANNSHISKKGQRGEFQRSQHAKFAARFAKLSPAAKQLIRDIDNHYRKTFDVENDAKVRFSLGQALSGYHKKLPSGKTIDDAVNWVRSGGAARTPDEQTAEDKAYHEALGNTAKTLAAIPELRRIKGFYAPMMRKGKYFISVKERPFGTLKDQKNVPAGAILDAVTDEEKDAPNRLLFRNRKDYDAFVGSHPGLIHASTRWVDPKTGKKVSHEFAEADPSVPGGIRHAQKLFVATVQNNRMEMSDSKRELARRQRELDSEGHRPSAIRFAKKDLHKIAEEIAPAQTKALLRNIEQTTIGSNTAAQAAVKGAVLDAVVRSMNTPGRLERHLKRRNVLGNETDILDALTGYNRSLASALAHYELAPQMAQADSELQKFIDSQAHTRDYDNHTTLVRQSMTDELRNRIKDTDRASGPKILQVAKDITFLRHLASPHYTIIQLTQPYMMTMPVLSSKYGRGAAWSELMKTMRMGGVRRSLGRGMKETWANFVPVIKATVGRGEARDAISYDEYWKTDIIKGQPDEAQLAEVIDEVVGLGFGASSGIEAQTVGEAGMTKPGIFLSRLVSMARALPEAAESTNRYLTAITTYRLAKRKGLDHQAALREAVLTVEETQGGYGAANNPAFFNNPYLAPATQFRKFSLAYGQLFYRNVAWGISHADPEQKKIARKTVARLALMTVGTAGVYGLAPVEIARHLVNVASLLGLKEDDWEEDENQIQEWLASVTSEGFSEAVMRGAPRIANLDLSGSLGVDNLAMFGQPEEMSSEGIYEWLAKAAAGAVGGDVGKTLDAYRQGDYLGALPLPKVIKNLIDAQQLAFTGTTDKKTGEVYMEPVGVAEAVYKGLGFRTASEAREWEAGGGGYENKQEKKDFYERRILMGRWSNAPSGTERARIWREDVREWNREHRDDPDMKIDMGDLQRSKKKRAKDRRERERERQK